MIRALLVLVLDLLPDHDIESHLLKHPREHLKGEYPHHPIVYVRPVAELIAAVVMVVLAVVGPVQIGWLPMMLAFGLFGHAAFLALRDHRDVFVLTDMRVFRVSGIFSTRRATVPINRILDVTVERPLLGRWLKYGHMTFESAAQEQGVRNIRYIGHVDKIDHAIQKVVQEAGLRGRRADKDGSDPNDAVTQQLFDGR
ncbi:PH domain-containing protein [Aeromicrobium sp.]|uniref:PH domain-containing protein n=1 Tax=Aeromicrobium sp. TaxID=1871063 RepID=UPI003C424C95